MKEQDIQKKFIRYVESEGGYVAKRVFSDVGIVLHPYAAESLLYEIKQDVNYANIT